MCSRDIIYMIRTRVFSRGSSQDGSSHDVHTESRVQSRSINRQSRSIDHNPSQDVQGHNNISDQLKSDVQSYPESLHGMSNAISDCETDESLYRPCMSQGAGFPKKQQKSDPSTSQPILESDSSSDSSAMSPKIIKNRKRPLSPTSSSDSSDSVRVTFRRSVKHRRVLSSSERSSPERSSDTDNHNIRQIQNYANSSNTRITEPPFYQNSREKNHENLTSSSDISNQISGERRPPITESDSDSDLITPNHSIWGRRIPIIETEDDTDSPMEDTSSRRLRVLNTHEVNPVLGIHNSRRRRRYNLRSERFLAINIGESSRMRHFGGNSWTVTTQIESTDENFTPLSNNRRVRGRRIPVVDSNSESDSGNNNEVVITPENGNAVVINFGSDVLNLRERRVPNINEHNIVSHYNLRRRNTALIQNEDESSSSDSDIRPRPLPNRIATILQSDDSTSNSSSDSDDSIPIRSPRRRNRSIPITDENGDIGGHFPDVSIKVSTVTSVPNEKKGTSDSDGETEKCPICLAGFKLQEIGRPKSCDHKFCSLCIKEWATRNNTCPVDRKIFDTIVVYDKCEGKIVNELPVEKTNSLIDYDFEFNEIQLADYLFTDSSESSWFIDDSDGDGPEEICYVCGSSNQPHRMITCDTCNNVYHLGCVNPPLRNFPTINWYCSYCDSLNNTSSDSV